MTHGNYVEFFCRFQICTHRSQFPDNRKVDFFICKLGDYIVEIDFKDAGLPEDQICQGWIDSIIISLFIRNHLMISWIWQIATAIHRLNRLKEIST